MPLFRRRRTTPPPAPRPTAPTTYPLYGDHRPPPPRSSAAAAADYRRQLDDALALVERLVGDLLVAPPPDPILVYVRDHGPAMTSVIATQLDISFLHVSAVLDDARERGVVEAYAHDGGVVWFVVDPRAATAARPALEAAA